LSELSLTLADEINENEKRIAVVERLNIEAKEKDLDVSERTRKLIDKTK